MRSSFYTTYLSEIYGAENEAGLGKRIQETVKRYRRSIPVPAESSLTEQDAILITYADQVQKTGVVPLQTLGEFCDTHFRDLISGVHILPFFPYSSDDGFSVMDYRAVDPALGRWEDVERMSRPFKLMFDLVINHASAQGMWFQRFLQDETPYNRYFLTVDGEPDLSKVIRPRALPLLTEYQTAGGLKKVWTTFSADQVDLDFNNPDVLLEMIDILLFYVRKGAQFIRMDAVAFLWKEIGTTCLHLPQTHATVRLLRAVLDEAAPHVRLITETNVPHHENISYFGDGQNEAQLVYNFALPPLVLHTIRNGDAAILTEWAAGLKLPSGETTFFNFLASHDGIGLNPVRGILPSDAMDALVGGAQAHGGLVSYKHNEDGTKTPYELNINYFDALSVPDDNEPLDLQVDRFMAAQAIMLSLRGVPGIYFHSLVGSRGWEEGAAKNGQNRTINRQKLQLEALEHELGDPKSRRAMVFKRYVQLLEKRKHSPAFHPHGRQEVLDFKGRVFAVERISPDGKSRILCMQNVTAEIQNAAGYTLGPYQTAWVDETG